MRRLPENGTPLKLPPGSETSPTPAEELDGASPWTILNDRLSGRWPHAIALALILALLGTVAGYRMTSVKYDATGIIHVSPKITPLMRDTPETGLTPLYASRVQSEARLVTHPQILERTLQYIDQDKMPWETVQQAMRGLETNLLVTTERQTELIHVAFRDESPAFAQHVTNAVLRAYDEIRGSVEGDEHGRKQRELRGQSTHYQEQWRQKNAELQELIRATGYPVSDFEDMINKRALYVEDLRSEIRRLRNQLEILVSRGADEPAGELPTDATAINPRELEFFDPELADLAKRRNLARLAFERARESYTPQHHAYITAENDLRVIERVYNERAAIVHEEYIAAGHMPSASTASEIRVRIDQLQEEIEEQQAMAQQMSRWQNSITNLRADIEQIERWRSDIDDRIRELDLESDAIRTGRIRIAAMADLPLRPSQDRRIPLAAMGAMGGFGMGIGVFFILGTFDRRIYIARQVAHRGAGASSRILGVLPALPDRAGDIESSSVAAHCVHQIRNHIESARAERGSMILIVSSPYQGDGKTSLVMALGSSYAAAGSNVLLLDCDLVGKNLTTHTMMNGQPGLREALRTGQVDGNAASIPIAGSAGSVSIFPGGCDPTFGPEMVRRDKLETVFAQLRREYDVILVDTGPLFGSIETLPAAAAAATFGGGVVLTMQRGRRHARLEECIDELRGAGANYLGLVLNYARISDCDRYVSKSRISAVITAQGSEVHTNGSARPKLRPPRASRNALLRAMQMTSRLDT